MQDCPEYRLIAGRYQQRELIGVGGLSEVFAAWDQVLGRYVALKRLRPEACELLRHEGLGQNEARNLAALQHPNICTIHDYGHDGDTIYFILELIAGRTLSEVLDDGPLVLSDFVPLAEQALEAMHVAHNRGILHLDLKPENFMVFRSPLGRLRLKILDFGLAKLLHQAQVDQQPSEKKTLMGTAEYMSPEQFFREPEDERSDIYSLGTVFYHSLAGVPPFTGKNAEEIAHAHVTREPKPLDLLRPDLPIPICRWVHSLMVMQRSRRPASIRAAMESFNQALDQARWFPTRDLVSQQTISPVDRELSPPPPPEFQVPLSAANPGNPDAPPAGKTTPFPPPNA